MEDFISLLQRRTDNEIKNLWNSSLKKKLIKQGIDPQTHEPLDPQLQSNNKDKDNDHTFLNSSDDHNNSQATATSTKTIKSEHQPYSPYIAAENTTSFLNSQFNVLEPFADACQGYQSLIQTEIHRQQMNVIRPTAELSQSQHSYILSSLDDNSFERGKLGEQGADCFSESLMFSEGKECSSSSSNNNILNNISRNASFSWENVDQKNFESEYFQYPYNNNYGLIKMEQSPDQHPNSWEEEQFKSLSLSEELAAPGSAGCCEVASLANADVQVIDDNICIMTSRASKRTKSNLRKYRTPAQGLLLLVLLAKISGCGRAWFSNMDIPRKALWWDPQGQKKIVSSFYEAQTGEFMNSHLIPPSKSALNPLQSLVTFFFSRSCFTAGVLT
ncbi:hypothetical protein RND81_10G229500 [Saponaria officinalis]|uniref:HTH myb-type domain-containing protein n=1 Tax=Saponaria officinalis TaxID=3572 RepID=A0AAW1I7Q4_SAPOF